MRVVGGKWKGKRLLSPESCNVRPTKGIVKEAMFNVLDCSETLFLDLFAGSGSVAFEALSLGARKAILVDINKDCVSLCINNAKTLGCINMVDVFMCSAIQAISRMKRGKIKADIIFLDPPYEQCDSLFGSNGILNSCMDVLSDYGVIVIEAESSCKVYIPESMEIIWSRKYGDSIICMCKAHC